MWASNKPRQVDGKTKFVCARCDLLCCVTNCHKWPNKTLHEVYASNWNAKYELNPRKRKTQKQTAKKVFSSFISSGQKDGKTHSLHEINIKGSIFVGDGTSVCAAKWSNWIRTCTPFHIYCFMWSANYNLKILILCLLQIILYGCFNLLMLNAAQVKIKHIIGYKH